MAKASGFMEYERQDGPVMPVGERIQSFVEFHDTLPLEEQKKQAARCMDCGVPFCQAGMLIGGMYSGCPLHNLVPEMNDLVYMGNLEQAYKRLSKTHCFPEFTSRVCPALCEAACTCGNHGKSVSTKENEKTVIEYAFANGLVEEEAPKVRTGKTIAIVGSGPAGLAAAMQLNRRGHSVTVFERHDRPGGLLRYGIPNMKLDKSVIDRRITLMEKAGISFQCNCNVGKDIKSEELLKNFDRVILSCGASNPRDIKVEGRETEGIYFAVDFLTEVTKSLSSNETLDAMKNLVKGKKVLVIGGGDTGNDCVGSVIRLGAGSVKQLEMMPPAPACRAADNPWPEWPKILKTDYGQEEAIELFGQDPRQYETTVKSFLKDKDGKLCGAELISLKPQFNEKSKRTQMIPVPGSEEKIDIDIVLIAAGFLGSEGYIVEDMGVKCDNRTNVETGEGSYETSVERVYTAGDMHRGQSLVVWAIAEGRNAAKQVDASLMGYTNL